MHCASVNRCSVPAMPAVVLTVSSSMSALTLIHWSSRETASLIPPSDNLEISLAASSVIFTFSFFAISHSRFVLSSTSILEKRNC